MTRLLTAAALVAMLPVTAQAQSGSSCSGTTQIDFNFCAKEKWKAADAELNRLWRLAKSTADSRGEGHALLEAQRSWLRQRDGKCDPELSGDGSAAPMFYWSCMEEMTLSRNAELRAMN